MLRSEKAHLAAEINHRIDTLLEITGPDSYPSFCPAADDAVH